MKTVCPHCGREVVVYTGGRRKLTLNVQMVKDTILACATLEEAAIKLQCGRTSIYRILDAEKLTAKRDGRFLKLVGKGA